MYDPWADFADHEDRIRVTDVRLHRGAMKQVIVIPCNGDQEICLKLNAQSYFGCNVKCLANRSTHSPMSEQNTRESIC